MAASFALPLAVDFGQPDSYFAAGVTLKYTVGHGLLLARDGGSAIDAEPLLIDLQFPMILPGNDSDRTTGSGVGLDVGAAWQSALGRNQVAPGLRVMIRPLLGSGVPPSSV